MLVILCQWLFIHYLIHISCPLMHLYISYRVLLIAKVKFIALKLIWLHAETASSACEKKKKEMLNH